MKFEDDLTPFLSDSEFSNALRVKISEKETTVLSRIEYLESLVRNKNIIHIGCVDHIPLIPWKIKNNIWLHKRLSDCTKRCLGIDLNEEGIQYLKTKLNYQDVIRLDITEEYPAKEIILQKWDYAIVGEILEHLNEPFSFLTSIKRNYSGIIDRIVITVPNAFRLPNFLFARKHIEYINSDHRFWFTPFTLAKLLSDAGMKVEEFQFCQDYPLTRKSIVRKIILKKYPAFRNVLVMVAKI
ncbi:MAG: hypothetical protein COT43_11480 [Candidatus Marinimicrobia bacterium CG08_land_8_20_14_0_20_45_22]|nr:MAG: hypothetical protein COT43_11480 [Candidatus Marinimicrobia bacterium CG08_land_8_20_14_0_20_45_22]